MPKIEIYIAMNEAGDCQVGLDATSVTNRLGHSAAVGAAASSRRANARAISRRLRWTSASKGWVHNI
jgi:hypothetical protein